MPQEKGAPAWPGVGEWPAISQGGRIDTAPPALSEVRAWIGEACGCRVAAVELVEIFALKGWAITALFRLAGGSEVVFKANRAGALARHAAVYDLLQRCCPRAVPEVIGKRVGEEGAWILYCAIEGQSVKALGRPELLPKIAETLAEIQAAFARLPAEATAAVPRWPTARIPDMLAELIRRVERYYLPRWEAAGGALLGRGGRERLIAVPERLIARLRACLPRVEVWTAELVAGGWPETIHHPDLNPGNAIVEPDGNLRIIDWDQAVVGLPFTSLYWLDYIAGESEWRDRAGGAVPVRDAYLGSVPWNDMEARSRAWDLGARLENILSAHESEAFNDALRRRQRTGGSIAMLLANALAQWER